MKALEKTIEVRKLTNNTPQAEAQKVIGDFIAFAKQHPSSLPRQAHQILHYIRTRNTIHRHPRKRSLRDSLTMWSDEDIYKGVQGRMRGVNWRGENYGQKLNVLNTASSLQQYMKRYAKRAPEMPPGEFVNGKAFVLYRGIHVLPAQFQNIINSGVYRESGFIATSRSQLTALEFAAKGGSWRGILFKVRHVRNGTPWIWYWKRPKSPQGVHRNFAVSQVPDEAEVLFPPGRMEFNPKDVATFTSTHEYYQQPVFKKIVVIDNVTFIPQPGYERKKPRRNHPNMSYKHPPLFP